MYGDTVYLGPTASNVAINRNDPANANWAGNTYRQARYAWRVEEFGIRPNMGTVLIVR